MGSISKHPDKALSAAKVRNVTEPGRYADGNGLYLIVESSGAKRWLLRTVVKGKRCDIGLGGLSLVSLAEAREEALRMRKLARSGGDPLEHRRKERRVILTFAEVARQVHIEHAPGWKNAKHAAQWINTLQDYVFPVFGDRRIDHVDSADVLRALSPIWLAKPETARRVRQRVELVLDWAKAHKMRIGDNPAARAEISKVLPKHGRVQAHHSALPYSKVPEFVQELRACDASASVKLAFEFTVLTAARTSEVLLATWDEIDIDHATWTVPAQRMKAKREHRVPLSARCVEILRHARDISDGPYVFPGSRSGKPISNMAFLMTLRRMGKDITAHGFRSSFRDWASEKTNYPREVCEAALAHTLQDKVEAAYRRGDLFEKRRELMIAWAAHVEEISAFPGILPPRSAF